MVYKLILETSDGVFVVGWKVNFNKALMMYNKWWMYNINVNVANIAEI